MYATLLLFFSVALAQYLFIWKTSEKNNYDNLRENVFNRIHGNVRYIYDDVLVATVTLECL